MFGIEVAGLSLGGIPLAILAIEHYIDLATGVKNTIDWRKTLQQLKMDLWLEDKHLGKTLLSMGIRRNTLNSCSLKNYVESHFPIEHDYILGVIHEIEETVASICEKLDVDIQGKVRTHLQVRTWFKCIDVLSL